MSAILQKNWATLGSKLEGKIHVYVGSADTYFLNDGVYYLEDVLNATKNPPYGGEVKYGDRVRTLLERRSERAQLSFAPALQHHVSSDNPRPHCEKTAPRRRRSEVLALLVVGASAI